MFNEGLTTLRDRCLFGICLYTACRINEACTLRRVDVYDKKRSATDDALDVLELLGLWLTVLFSA